MSAVLPYAEQARPAVAPAVALRLALLPIPIALACSQPIGPAFGVELYAGPLCYLLALRWYGLRAGLAMAAITMAPSWLWLGHPLLLLIALLHVACVHRLYPRLLSCSSVTAAFQLVLGAAVIGLLVTAHWAPAVEAALVVVLRTIIGTMAMAFAADAMLLLVVRDPAGGGLRRRRLLPLGGALDLLVSSAILGGCVLFMLGAFRDLPQRIEDFADQAPGAVTLSPPPAGERDVVPVRVGTTAGMVDVVAIDPGTARGATMARLGCRQTDLVADDSRERRTIVHWLQTCLVRTLPDGRIVVLSLRPYVERLLGGVLYDLLPLFLFLIATQGALFAMRRALARSIAVWDDALARFGRSETIGDAAVPFEETRDLLEVFGALSNSFVAANRERDRLARAVDELRATLDLKLLSDVWFDPDRCELRFVKVDPVAGRREMRLDVHPADRQAMATLAPQPDVAVELRVGPRDDANWYMLLAHDYDPALRGWRFGCIVRLRAAKAFQTRMRHHARLIELGGMASALSHELRQPLFTIALAAENGTAALAAGPEQQPRVAQKFGRILEQVERMTAIVERTSRYARLERDGHEPVDLIDAIRNAMRFMAPMLDDHGVALALDAPATIAPRRLPRVGIEQIVVNALQNAIDSIDQAREAGAVPAGRIGITVTVAETGGSVAVAIEDDGAGLADSVAASAFDAFSTTKPVGKGTGVGLFVCRQIMDEVGGAITLAGRAAGRGATLTLIFPPAEAAT